MKFTVEITTTKEIPNLIDVIGNRLWSLDGVHNVEVAPAQVPEQVKTFDFDEAITQFNQLYKLPALAAPAITHASPEDLAHHLAHFKHILLDELNEVDALIDSVMQGTVKIDILTELADWLGDITVYCASEAKKFGIPLELVLSIIMASNMSKLDKDGKPIYDEKGKVLKGPYYWKPEGQIRRALEATQRQAAGGKK
jgi:predicted HAD superfamily Cof-like phosphohydrolase